MKMWSALFNFFGVFLLLYFVFILHKDIRENQQQFDELRLKYAIDYATEAGFQSAIVSGNLGIDYLDLENVKVKGDNVLPVFKSVMAMTYDIAITDENMSMLDSYISSAVLSDSNGYYLATMQEVDNGNSSEKGGEYELKWGLKRPFVVEYNNGQTIINYNIGTEKWRLAKQVGSDVVIETGITWDDTIIGTYENCSGFTKEQCRENIRNKMLLEVNKRVTEDLNYNIKQRNEEFSKHGIKHQFVYLPSTQTEAGVNAIKKPSLFVTMSGVDFAGLKKIDIQSVGGFTIVSKIRVIGFLENGKQFYAYEGQVPDEILNGGSTRFFNNVEEAALRGYEPHILYLQKPKVKK